MDIEKDVKNIEKQLAECKGEVSQSGLNDRMEEATGFKFASKMLTIEENINTINSNIQRVVKSKEEKPKALYTSIIFGVIASSISILALNLTDSKILDFEKPTDYFILWGWCILGAIYAKRWIESLYGKLTNLVKSDT